MDDLISREEAIEKIESLWNSIRRLHPLLDDTMALYADVKRIIKQLPSAQQWIPVSKKLPKETEEYLITCKDQDGDTYVKKTMYFPDEELWWGIYSSETVTAWMPVPEPYREL